MSHPALPGSSCNSAYRNTLAPHVAALPPAARNAAAASVAAAHAVAARLPGPARRPLIHATYLAYTHGMARAATLSIALLVTCAVLCLILLPGKPKPTAPFTRAG